MHEEIHIQKRHTHSYLNPRFKNPHKQEFDTHVHQFMHTQHLDPICAPTLASPKPLCTGTHVHTHTQSQGLLSGHGHPLSQQPPPHKAVHSSLSPSIFIFLLHKTSLAGQDRKHTFLFLEPQARAEGDKRGMLDNTGDEGRWGGHRLSPPAIGLAQDNTPCYKVTPVTHPSQVKTLPYK